MEPCIEMEEGAEEGVEVAECCLLQPLRSSNYGSVEGLDDEELADPDELERQVMLQEWGPIMALPVKTRRGWIQPAVDESGGVDFGAFGTVDFARTMPEFDKARYKAEKVGERLRDKLIMLSIVDHRLPGNAKHLVLKYLRLGIIDIGHIVNDDMLALAKLFLETRRLQEEMLQLRERSRQLKQHRLEAWLERLA